MDIQAEKTIREIKKGLLRWYDFKVSGRAMYIGKRDDALAEELTEHLPEVICEDVDRTIQDDWQQEYAGYFDYIVSVADLEKWKGPENVLVCWKNLLKPDGRMLLGMNNRLGLRYFCGDRESYTGRSFDGIENYRRVYVKNQDTFQGRMYDRASLTRMLRDSGWQSFQFFSVLTDLENPSHIYAGDFLPNEDLANRIFPTYN